MLDGTYRIARVVGSGGFGITYEAEDINLATTGRHQGVLPLRVRRSRRHHERAAQVGPAQADVRVGPLEFPARRRARWRASSIPSIVRVCRVFEANSTAYMVMRFEQGKNFEAWLRSLGRPPTQEELDRIAGAFARCAGDDARRRISCTATSPPTTSWCAQTARLCCSTSARRDGRLPRKAAH